MDKENLDISAATAHKCDGIGSLKAVGTEGSSKVEVLRISGARLGLEPVDIAVQHMASGRTRPICIHLEDETHCNRLQEATGSACLMVLNKKVEVGGSPVTGYEHQKHMCKWKVQPINKD